MPRQAAVVTENNFIKGLITETTAVKFPPNAATETYNCVFEETGRVTRRLGLDIEDDFIPRTVTEESGEVFTEFFWQGVGGDGTKNFLVVQQGRTLRFFNLSNDLAASDNYQSFTVVLQDYIPDGSTADSETEQYQYATHNGNLLVVGPTIDPIYITYTAVSDTITTTAIELKIRDFAGADDDFALTERPTDSVATLQADHPGHYYNLLNQGWYHGTTGTAGADNGATLAQWDTARTDMPSNADTVGLYRSSATDAFDNANVLANSPGNRPAPKGHFILSPTNPDRNAAMIAEGFTGATIGVDSSPIDRTTGTYIGSHADTSKAFDEHSTGSWISGGADTPSSVTAATSYIGKKLSTPTRIAGVSMTSVSDGGFVTVSNPSITMDLYVGNTAPSSSTDGVIIGTVTFSDLSTIQTVNITSTNTSDTFEYVWVRINPGSSVQHGVGNMIINAVVSVSGTPATYQRPSTIATFAGRVFYAGINDIGLNSSIFFTRIVEQNNQYQECYQTNDPTSQEFFDLLPDDGGVIKIPEIAIVKKLFAYQSSLIVLATNGVWRISGGQGGFAANDYKVNKLSSIGFDAPLSVVDYKGLPIWWSEDGINTIQYDANYDSFAVVSLTDSTIKSFILDIPEFNRQYVKGAFDIHEDCIYWLYNSEADLEVREYYKYNAVLVMNGLSKAFYPWTIGDGTPDVRGLCYVSDGARSVTPRIKYVTTVNQTGSEEDICFAEFKNTNYLDWETEYANDVDYDSYFITGYRLDAQGIRFFQSNYVWVFLEMETNASCFVQGIWDWTTSSSTGKWSTVQQVYSSSLVDRVLNWRRLKVRGKGKALQLKFYSETGKPFTITGWAIQESANSGI
jgi:hypothetical protein